jgi:transposase
MTTLTIQDEKRLEVIQRALREELTVEEAATILGVSERQCYRIKVRVKEHGAKEVIHGNRGRPCKRKVKEKTVSRVVALAGRISGI